MTSPLRHLKLRAVCLHISNIYCLLEVIPCSVSSVMQLDHLVAILSAPRSLESSLSSVSAVVMKSEGLGLLLPWVLSVFFGDLHQTQRFNFRFPRKYTVQLKVAVDAASSPKVMVIPYTFFNQVKFFSFIWHWLQYVLRFPHSFVQTDTYISEF